MEVMEILVETAVAAAVLEVVGEQETAAMEEVRVKDMLLFLLILLLKVDGME